MQPMSGNVSAWKPNDGTLILLAVGAVALLGFASAILPSLTVVAVGAGIAAVTLTVLIRQVRCGLRAAPGSYLAPVALSLAFISLIPIQLRDPTAEGLGIQSIYEFSLQGLTMALILIALAGKRMRLDITPALVLWVGFGLWALFSAYWAPQMPLAALKGLQLIALAIIATAAASQFQDRYQAVRFLAWLTVLAIIGMAFVQLVIAGPVSLIVGYEFGRQRLTLLALHPLVLGGLAGAVAVLLLVHRPRGLDWLAFAALAAVTALADARAPLALLIVMTILYLVLRSGFTAYSRIVGVVVGSVAAILVIALWLIVANSPTYSAPEVLPDHDSEEVRTLNGRIPLWEAVFEQGQQQSDVERGTLFGHGFASFRHFGLDRYAFAGDAHNAPIQVLFELGVVGVVVWTFAVLACARLIWNHTGDSRSSLISLIPVLYILGVQMLEASLADSRSFLLVVLLVYAHAGSRSAMNDSDPG